MGSAFYLPCAETWSPENLCATSVGHLSFNGWEEGDLLWSCESLFSCFSTSMCWYNRPRWHVISAMPAMYHLDSFSIRSSCSGWYAIDLFSWFSPWLPGGHWMPLWNRLSAYSYSAGVRMDFIHLFWVWPPWKISWPLLPAQGHCHTCRLQVRKHP